jgi:anti-anti-sigma regulatory factor
MIPVNATTVRLQALGEHTRLVVAGTSIGHDTAAACEEAVDVESASGARDFVFDLSRVGRHDTGALRSIADLWRRLHGLGCAGVVAAANLAVCLNRVIPARSKWTLKPTRDEALIHLLASPV